MPSSVNRKTVGSVSEGRPIMPEPMLKDVKDRHSKKKKTVK